MLPKFAYSQPRTLASAVKELTSPGARIHSGGTDLLGCLRAGVFTADKVVSLSGIDGLSGIKKLVDGGVAIGGMTTITDIANDEFIAGNYAALNQAAKVIASPQLRNQGTIAGNICQRPRCWYYRGEFNCARKGGDTCFALNGENAYHCIFGGDPCYIVHPSDSAPALTALRAKLKITGPDGDRTVPIDDFFVLPEDDLFNENVLKPNEIVTGIILPAANGTKSTYRKVRERGSWDFALVSAAVALQISNGVVGNARIVLGGVAPKPWRVPEAEKLLAGKALDKDLAKQVAEAAMAGAKPLEQNAYKVTMAKGALFEALHALI